jgi:hypothetical protein
LKNLSWAVVVIVVLSATAASAQTPQLYMGFRNPDGSLDTFGPNGEVYMGFRNPDGSQDTFGPHGEAYMGFRNPDGSHDTFGPIGASVSTSGRLGVHGMTTITSDR